LSYRPVDGINIRRESCNCTLYGVGVKSPGGWTGAPGP